MQQVTGYSYNICSIEHPTPDRDQKCETALTKKSLKGKKYKDKRNINLIRYEIDYVHAIPEAFKKYVKEILDLSVKLTFKSVRYSNSQSNSHCCPVKGMLNWGNNNKNAPRGYPRYHVCFERSVYNHTYHLINLFAESFSREKEIRFRGLNFTGGSSVCGTLVIFIDDFPKIKAKFDRIKKYA